MARKGKNNGETPPPAVPNLLGNVGDVSDAPSAGESTATSTSEETSEVPVGKPDADTIKADGEAGSVARESDEQNQEGESLGKSNESTPKQSTPDAADGNAGADITQDATTTPAQDSDSSPICHSAGEIRLSDAELKLELERFAETRNARMFTSLLQAIMEFTPEYSRRALQRGEKGLHGDCQALMGCARQVGRRIGLML